MTTWAYDTSKKAASWIKEQFIQSSSWITTSITKYWENISDAVWESQDFQKWEDWG